MINFLQATEEDSFTDIIALVIALYPNLVWPLGFHPQRHTLGVGGTQSAPAELLIY